MTDERLVRRAHIVDAEVDGEVVALDGQSANFYGMNDVASRIWRLLAEPITPDEVCDALLAEYDVSRPECERAVRRHIAELIAEGLIGPADS